MCVCSVGARIAFYACVFCLCEYVCMRVGVYVLFSYVCIACMCIKLCAHVRQHATGSLLKRVKVQQAHALEPYRSSPQNAHKSEVIDGIGDDQGKEAAPSCVEFLNMEQIRCLPIHQCCKCSKFVRQSN